MEPIVGITQEPKPLRNHKYDWEGAAQRCRDEPGEWVLIYRDIPHSSVTSLASGRIKHLPLEQFEYRTENNHRLVGVTNGRRCDLYLRYVGPTKEKKK